MARHLLVTNDYPPKTGGIQVYLHELWRRLDDGRSVVLTASSHEGAADFDASSTVTVERVEGSTLFLPTLRVLRAIEAAIERHQPDLVLLDPAWPLGLLGPRLSRPYGVILHGAEVAIPGRIPLVASSLRYVLKNATVAVAAGPYPESEAVRNAAERLCPVLQIPPGVDASRFTPLSGAARESARHDLGLGDDDFVIASYSRLVPRKGMDTLIRASAMLSGSYPNLRVVIGGTGRDRARLDRLATKLSAPVTFLGYVNDDAQPRWIGASDLMVMACRSRWLGLEQEGFGIVFVEAAACGLAQIAGRSGGSHDAVRDGETGIVLQNSGSARELADAIESLMLDDERRTRYARQARALALANFSWNSLALELGTGLEPFDRFKAASSLA
ncbi:MAG TPA: glycosyltransferase family 4 protein [Acidimicrobiales bacterium]|jgi:phosphatidylinositol alpha-1,6-mannosyltransferase|nr:glycosyltransferase family 4 protein [Acidimicrobiales bacterium]